MRGTRERLYLRSLIEIRHDGSAILPWFICPSGADPDESWLRIRLGRRSFDTLTGAQAARRKFARQLWREARNAVRDPWWSSRTRRALYDHVNSERFDGSA